ncbi:MAG: hypothetical protein SPK06_07020 [Kiritimatiellia bacterium]|nr:hypothetical protein [Kiritimatiellia bacterium]
MKAFRIALMVFRTAVRTPACYFVALLIPLSVGLLACALSGEGSSTSAGMVLSWSLLLGWALLAASGMLLGANLIGGEFASGRFRTLKCQPVRAFDWLFGAWGGLAGVGGGVALVLTLTLAFAAGVRGGKEFWTRPGNCVSESRTLAPRPELIAPGESNTYHFGARGRGWSLRVAFSPLGGWHDTVALVATSGGERCQATAGSGDNLLVPLVDCNGSVTLTNRETRPFAALYYNLSVPVALVRPGMPFVVNLANLWLVSTALFALWAAIGTLSATLFSRPVAIFIGCIVALLPLIASEPTTPMPTSLGHLPGWLIAQGIAWIGCPFAQLQASDALARGDLLNPSRTLLVAAVYGVIIPLILLGLGAPAFRRREQ